jgi:hypothetical protein
MNMRALQKAWPELAVAVATLIIVRLLDGGVIESGGLYWALLQARRMLRDLHEGAPA